MNSPKTALARHPVSLGATRLAEGVGAALRQVANGLRRWRQRRIAVRELQALSDRQLLDIGIDRARIVSVVEKNI